MALGYFDQFKDECLEQLSSLQDEFMKLYDITSYEHWYFDHGAGHTDQR
ncbi:hypothetical protein [Chryseolinea soli]|nr:hypothetical protein [Chryseolinea soli]